MVTALLHRYMESDKASQKRLVIVCLGLESVGIDEYHYTKAVLEAAQGRGYEVQAWGRKDAEEIRQAPWFRPVFSEPRHNAPVDSYLRRAWRAARRELTWFGELRKALKNVSWSPGDKVFVHTFRLSSAWQWWWLQKWFAARKLHLFLFLRFSPSFVAIPRDRRWLYLFVIRQLGAYPRYIHLLTVSEEVRLEYERIVHRPVYVLNQIVPSAFSEAQWDEQRAEPSLDGVITVGFVGHARMEKGFDLLPEAIRLLSQKLPEQSVRFLIQCYAEGMHRREPEYLTALERLKEMQSRARNIQLAESQLSFSDYARFLSSMDIALHPHRATSQYAVVPSGTFADAVVMGKQCVVSDGTWLAGQVRTLGWGQIFRSGDAADLADAVVRAIESWRRGERLRTEKRSAWIQKHQPGELVSFLEELAKGSIAGDGDPPGS